MPSLPLKMMLRMDTKIRESSVVQPLELILLKKCIICCVSIIY